MGLSLLHCFQMIDHFPLLLFYVTSVREGTETVPVTLSLFLCGCQVMSDSFVTLWAIAHQLLCPWDFPGKDTGVGCHFLLQGIFWIQGSNSHLLHWRVDSSSLSHMHTCSVASVVSDSVQPYGQQPSRLLCPQDSPDKNTGVGCHFFLPRGAQINYTSILKIHCQRYAKSTKFWFCICMQVHMFASMKVWPFPNVMVFGGGAWRKWLGHEGGALMNGTAASDKETPESSFTPLLCEDPARRQPPVD